MELGIAVNPEVSRAKNVIPRGDPLDERIRDGLTGSLAEQTAMAIQIARELRAWHGKGEVHGQLSSRMVFLDEKNVITLYGGVDGAEKESDINGFGLVLYEILSGHWLLEIPQNPPDVEPLYKAGITPRLVEIVRRCTSAEDRPADLSKIIDDLEAVLREMSGKRTGPWKRWCGWFQAS